MDRNRVNKTPMKVLTNNAEQVLDELEKTLHRSSMLEGERQEMELHVSQMRLAVALMHHKFIQEVPRSMWIGGE